VYYYKSKKKKVSVVTSVTPLTSKSSDFSPATLPQPL
jgi:hypothetical protein